MGSLKIDSLTYGNINFNSNNRTLPTSNFTLSKTYVATMKQSVVKKAVYIILGVTLTGEKEVLGFYISEVESAKQWAQIVNSKF